MCETCDVARQWVDAAMRIRDIEDKLAAEQAVRPLGPLAMMGVDPMPAYMSGGVDCSFDGVSNAGNDEHADCDAEITRMRAALDAAYREGERLRTALAVFANEKNWRETDWRSLGMSSPEWTWARAGQPWNVALQALKDNH